MPPPLLKQHAILNVCKHYGSVIFLCSWEIFKQVLTFKNILDEQPTKIFRVKFFINNIYIQMFWEYY